MRKVQFWLIACCFCVIVVVGILSASNNTDAPDIGVVTITGKNISLKALLGKPVIVSFWATDCSACIKEIPQLQSLYQQYHARGLEIIAIAMPYNPPNLVVELSKQRLLAYDVVLDINADYVNAFGGIHFIPSTFVISPDGKIFSRITGVPDFDYIKKTIENFLKG
jgi:peroxiredoxin